MRLRLGQIPWAPPVSPFGPPRTAEGLQGCVLVGYSSGYPEPEEPVRGTVERERAAGRFVAPVPAEGGTVAWWSCPPGPRVGIPLPPAIPPPPPTPPPVPPTRCPAGTYRTFDPMSGLARCLPLAAPPPFPVPAPPPAPAPVPAWRREYFNFLLVAWDRACRVGDRQLMALVESRLGPLGVRFNRANCAVGRSPASP